MLSYMGLNIVKLKKNITMSNLINSHPKTLACMICNETKLDMISHEMLETCCGHAALF